MQKTIKYTTVLAEDSVDALKNMAARREISSVNQGIRLAVERFIEEEKKAAYARAMRDAAADADFLERTMNAQEDFARIDQEEMGAW